MALSDTAVRNAKPKDKPFKLYDLDGLYLLVAPSGGKLWRQKYRHAGKEKLLALGAYPEVSLKDARERRDAARIQVAQGLDPAQLRREQKVAQVEEVTGSFETVAREWIAKAGPHWSAGHAQTLSTRLARDVFPWLGAKPVGAITAPELLTCLRRIESRGAIETAHRVKQTCGQVFRYAIATGRAVRDPAADLRGALAPVKPTHHASITEPKAAGGLLRAIEGYQGHLVTRCALRLAPLVFVRPGELRQAEWTEFNLDGAEWRIPAARMKMGEQHIVPLSRQALELLREMWALTGRGRYVFPSARSPERPMSNNAVLAALRRLGYGKDEMTGHGFRSMASTLLNEQGWNRDAIERQLAHGERNQVRAAYNYAEYLPERRKMMQAWADYLDKLRAGADVIPLRPVA
jgi:integrase